MKPQESEPGPAGRKKAQQLTIAQLAAYDDILTDALVDHVSAQRHDWQRSSN